MNHSFLEAEGCSPAEIDKRFTNWAVLLLWSCHQIVRSAGIALDCNQTQINDNRPTRRREATCVKLSIDARASEFERQSSVCRARPVCRCRCRGQSPTGCCLAAGPRIHRPLQPRFCGAQKDFATWQQLHPEDPMGPVSEAAGFLFSEFNRLGVLEAQFYENDDCIRRPSEADS